MKILLLLLFALPCFAGDPEIFAEYVTIGDTILQSEAVKEKDIQAFQEKKAVLEKHEFKEGKVDQISERVEAHIRSLKDLEHKSVRYAFVDYSSWQENVTLKTPSGNKTLIVTNQGWCPGLAFGKRNVRSHYAVEGCFLFGRGDIGSQSSSINYKQSNVYGKGLKITPAAGLVSSSAGAELGLKVPLIWFDQSFSDPKLPGYQTKKPDAFHAYASIYARWPLGSWFLQSDFGKNLGKDLTLWSIGIGKSF